MAAAILNQHERNGITVYASTPEIKSGNKIEFASGHTLDVDHILYSSDYVSEPTILGRGIETNPFL